MFGSGREAHPDVREWSGGPNGWSGDIPKCPGVVGRTARMPGCGRKALLDVRKWSGGIPSCLGVVGSPSRTSESGREALSDVREWSEALPEVREMLGGPP